jgi:tRNA(Ile2)-agmatinylcytidine synthase
MSKQLVQIGMDDIDSPEGGCTTHFASLLVEKLNKKKVEWMDYPNLIRLNPGIPYRTRGNGAVVLRFRIGQNEIAPLSEMVENLIHNYVDYEYSNTNPGVVFLFDEIPEQVRDLSKLAMWRVVPIELAQRLIARYKIHHYAQGNERGLIGALASVANELTEDHTYEYIAYRASDNCKESRGVDAESVLAMNQKMGDRVFSNIDPAASRILIEPHGPDPVIFGVRGEKAEYVIEAAKQVRSAQQVERWLVFRTNQGTGGHLKHQVEIKNLRPYMAALVIGKVNNEPKMTEGGHVIFSIADESGSVDCAAYEPSGEFRETIMKLIVGDLIGAYSGVRPSSRTHGLTLNLEGIEVKELAKTTEFSNPLCPNCGRRMKSAGRGKGYKCTKCGLKDTDITKIETAVKRDLHVGLYLPPERAQRHLTRPLVRIDKTNSGKASHLVAEWSSH